MDSVDQANWYPGFGHDREMDWLRNMHDWMISQESGIMAWRCPSMNVTNAAISTSLAAAKSCRNGPLKAGKNSTATRRTGRTSTRENRLPHCGEPVAHQRCGQSLAGCRHRRHQHGSLQHRPRLLAKMVPGRLDQRELPGQFRNWFYSLLAQSTLMADGVGPFKNLFGYSSLDAEDGREMHKSWGNMIEFNEAADVMGADTMRWLYASSKPEQNLRFGYHVAMTRAAASSSRCGMSMPSLSLMPSWMAGRQMAKRPYPTTQPTPS